MIDSKKLLLQFQHLSVVSHPFPEDATNDQKRQWVLQRIKVIEFFLTIVDDGFGQIAREPALELLEELEAYKAIINHALEKERAK